MPLEIILIAAVTVDGFIARHNKEITKWTQDLHLFKEQTMGYPVIMGSNTQKTLSNDLLGRDVIVVHRDDSPKDIINKISSNRCFIAGGGKTYSKFYSFITHAYITPHPRIVGGGVS
jgi:dihydrofolate reductase